MARTLRIVVIVAVLALMVTALAGPTPQIAGKPSVIEVQESGVGQIEDRHNLPVVYGDRYLFEMPGTSIQSGSSLRQGVSSSPGLNICASGQMYDLQANDDGQRRIATLGDGGRVHFAWTHNDVIPDWNISRYANYNAYTSTGGLVFWDCGVTISGADGDPKRAMGSFPCVDAGSDDLGHVALQERNLTSQGSDPPGPLGTWVLDQTLPTSDIFNETELTGSHDAETMWPHLAIDRGGASKAPGDDVYHVVAHPSGYEGGFGDELIYWRRIGDYPATWEGPVVLDINAGTLNHHIATDPTSDRAAVVYETDNNPADLLQVVYLQSAVNGIDWIGMGVLHYPTPLTSLGFAPVHVTSYDDPNGPQAWVECTGEYDLDGRLHVVWVEQKVANVSSACRLVHWDEATLTAHVIRQAYDFLNAGNDGARDLWLASPQIAFGDGSTLCTDGPMNPGPGGSTSNRNYVYVSHEQYGGPTTVEGEDHSAIPSEGGPNQNLEIYLSVSDDRGITWSPAENLTGTKTPDCDGTFGNECASERDPSMALIVNDTIHITYILDADAGDAELGQGWWTYNPVKYLRISGGTDSHPVCPTLAPQIAVSLSGSDSDCEYHTSLDPPGSVTEELTISNLGNAALTGDVSIVPVSATWLQVATGAYSLAPGDAADVRPVTMDAADVSIAGEGLYQAQIEITHNDPSLPSPKVFPVDFFVFNEFYCPEYATLHTESLWLKVGSTGRIGKQNFGASGLSRLNGDSSWSIYDGSLIIGVPPSPDTLVYRNLYGWGNGQPGYRALGGLEIDTNAYGTNTGSATAFARMTTSDSTIGIDVRYTFPQGPDSANFVLIDYLFYNRTEDTIGGLAVGDAVDFDVVPEPDSLRDVQRGNQNTGHILETWNLLYQQGADTANHTVIGDATATRFKGGVTAIQCDPAPRAWIAPNDPWLYRSGAIGFQEGYLYQEMTKAGFELFPPNDPNPEEDIHSVMVFAQNLTLSPADSVRYTVGLVSSNQGNNDPTDLIAATKKAWRYAFGWQDMPERFYEDDPFSPHSFPYRILGVHEDGVGSGCCGCIVEKVSGSEYLTITPGPDACEGTIDVAPADPCCVDFGLYATFRVTDLCGTYEDLCVVEVNSNYECECVCPYPGDYDADGFITAIDLGNLIDVLFAGKPDITDPICLTSRCDFDCDAFATSLDLSKMIDHLFAGGAGPCEPCCEIK